MDYSLDTIEEKLMHLKMHLWDLQREQDNRGNAAMAYVLEHLMMIANNTLCEYEDLMENHIGPLKENNA